MQMATCSFEALNILWDQELRCQNLYSYYSERMHNLSVAQEEDSQQCWQYQNDQKLFPNSSPYGGNGVLVAVVNGRFTWQSFLPAAPVSRGTGTNPARETLETEKGMCLSSLLSLPKQNFDYMKCPQMLIWMFG